MNHFKLTDKCLPTLAIANILIISTLLWVFQQPLTLVWIAKHDGHTGAWLLLLLKMLFYIGIQLLIYLALAVCFFKKYRLALFFTIPYAIYMLPKHFSVAYNYYLHPLQSNSALYLSSKVYAWSNIIVIIASLTTCFIYIWEINKNKKQASLS